MKSEESTIPMIANVFFSDLRPNTPRIMPGIGRKTAKKGRRTVKGNSLTPIIREEMANQSSLFFVLFELCVIGLPYGACAVGLPYGA